MNTHPVTEEGVMAYLDGELPHGAASDIAAHLERCKDCQAVAADLQSVSRLLYAWSLDSANLEMSRELRAELDSKEETQEQPKRNLFGWLAAHRAWAVFSAGGVLVLAGLLITASRSVQNSKVVTLRSNMASEEEHAEALGQFEQGAKMPLVNLRRSESNQPAQMSKPVHTPHC